MKEDHKKYSQALAINVNLVQSSYENNAEIKTLENQIEEESAEVGKLTESLKAAT